MVYATNCSRLIFSLQLTTFPKEVVWKITPGDAKHIAVRADGKLFVVASDGQLWTRSSRSSEWKHYESPKPLLQIYPAVGGAAWAVDESNRVLFKPQFANRDGWEQVIGPEMLSLSVSADGNHVWGVTTDGCLCCRNCGAGDMLGIPVRRPYCSGQIETGLRQSRWRLSVGGRCECRTVQHLLDEGLVTRGPVSSIPTVQHGVRMPPSL